MQWSKEKEKSSGSCLRNMAATCAADVAFKPVIKDYVGHKLRSKGLHVAGYDEETTVLRDAALTLRRVGGELEASSPELFLGMCEQLQINSSSAEVTFQGIADEIFSTGKNWGRIVAFIVFGSTLAVHSACSEDMGESYVDTIVNWIAIYMHQHLGDWMRAHGFWEGFVEFFQKPNDQENERRNGFIFSALAGLGIGALLMLSVK